MKRELLFLVSLSLVYIPLFPPRMNGELTFSRAWAILPESEATQPVDGAEVVPYRIASRFGYVTPGGVHAYTEPVLYDATVSAEGFINYSSLGADLVVQRPDGALEATLDTTGYPALLERRLFVFATNRLRIEEWNLAGDRIWSRDFPALVTAFDARGRSAVVGMLDGRLQVLDADGVIRFEREFDSARISAVYGCAVTPDGRAFAVVHGLGDQTLSVFLRTDVGYEPAVSYVLDREFRTNRLLEISSDGQTIFVEDRDAVAVYRLRRAPVQSLALSGRLVEAGRLESPPAPSVVWFASVGETGRAQLVMASREGIRYASTSFLAGVLYGHSRDGYAVFGTDDRVGRIDAVVR